MGTLAPAPISTNPARRLVSDLRTERSFARPLPPGEKSFSLPRTRRFESDPLPLLLDCYARYGPIFTLRILHACGVFMLGPEANHYVTVSHAANFRWREGSMGDLVPLLGDGLLTIDGDYHRRARRIMLPAFHKDQIAAAATTMVEEVDRATAPWEVGDQLNLYHWTRALALRIAMRALFGFDPDRSAPGVDPAEEFEHALGYYGRDYLLQMLRGPLTPWRRMHSARQRLDRLIFDEIGRRRKTGERGVDLLSLLLEARDEEGEGFSDQELRDQIMTLLFAGHDTTTSTVTFLFHELAGHRGALDRVLAEQDLALGDRPPAAADLMGGLPELEMAMDETLRLYPAAWVGPRRAVEAFEFAGHAVPAGAPVFYCSWASHHLPDVWDEPRAFRPERFSAENKARLPKGAYVPFGGGSRTCIGMRFGQLEIKAIATRILQRFTVELAPDWRLSVRQMPTLSPRGGMPVTLRSRPDPVRSGEATPDRAAA